MGEKRTLGFLSGVLLGVGVYYNSGLRYAVMLVDGQDGTVMTALVSTPSTQEQSTLPSSSRLIATTSSRL